MWTSAHNNVLKLPFSTEIGTQLTLEIVVWDEDNLKAHDHIGELQPLEFRHNSLCDGFKLPLTQVRSRSM
jgi:hypothetical protein